jgi:hypothetical protein
MSWIEMIHKDGVPWWDAPLPRRWHRCWPQTTGWVGMTRTQRCACGAMRTGFDRGWSFRNETRKAQRAARS